MQKRSRLVARTAPSGEKAKRGNLEGKPHSQNSNRISSVLQMQRLLFEFSPQILLSHDSRDAATRIEDSGALFEEKTMHVI